jgi:hypothetical protein
MMPLAAKYRVSFYMTATSLGVQKASKNRAAVGVWDEVRIGILRR